MTVKPARTLEEKVDWRQIGHHGIETDVQALLQNLCRDNHTAPWSVRILAIPVLAENLPLNLKPSCQCEPGMKEDKFILRKFFFQLFVELLRLCDGIDDAGSATIPFHKPHNGIRHKGDFVGFIHNVRNELKGIG